MDAPDRHRGGWSTAPGGPPPPGQPATASGAPSQNDAGAGGGSASPDPSQDTSSLPAISLPKGGGAIRGIDEKLTVGQATGTASLTVAIPATQARQGFGPSLALGYDSGAGNGPFGLGWSLPVASITRKTSTGLPRYEDGDVFILSAVEDLVPSQQPPTGGSPRTVGAATYDIAAYRPRVEAGFARIERWQDTASGDVHWRTITADNVTSLYGQDSSSRIADPADPSLIFSWLLDLSYDDRGNAISYVYVAEDGVGAPDLANERNRVTTANRYLKEIRYGNDSPYLPGVKGNTDLPATPADWLFRVVLDYGEHSDQSPQPDPDPGAVWSTREDPFSSYRSGFEVRTYRTCRRILMFHQLPELADGAAVLVRCTELAYATAGEATLPQLTQLTALTQTGYVGTQSESLPPLQFGYQPLAIDPEVHVVDRGLEPNFTGVFGPGHERWTDLDGEGLIGVLTEDEGAWYYMHNVSTWNPAGGPAAARFEPLRVVAGKPAGPVPDAALTLTDLDGDGNLAAVSFAPPSPGWFEYDADEGWGPFREFERTANVDFTSPYLRFVDLDGDGLADVLITDDDALRWYEWDLERGFDAADRVANPVDEERGPTVVFADQTASIFLADMSGDGLTDIVRIRSGEVCYWPNLGYGRFGAKVTMDGAPPFDSPDLFDARKIRLADIDGSGTADVAYLGARATIWFNQSGNSLTASTVFDGFPSVDPDVEGSVFDLLGKGTACLVWTSPLPGDAPAPLRYIDLVDTKPYLLTQLANGLGATTTLTYAPSTKFYLQDRAAGMPWVTRLPFPVHVVERTQTDDAVSATRYACTYSYHHGFYDPTEREFRGFARVDSLDADTVPAPSGVGSFTATPPGDAAGDEFELAPVLTRTWFHTGAFFGAQDIASHLRGEYWPLDPDAPQLGPAAFFTDMPRTAGATALDPEQLREACRALRGQVLRQEVYAHDGSSGQPNPFTTSDHRYEVDMIQPPAGGHYGVFYAWQREALNSSYERNPADPRISHELSLAIDGYGHVIEHASIGYPRRNPGGLSLPAPQTKTLISYLETQYAAADTEPDAYRISLPVETRTYELTGLQPAAGATLLDPDTLLGALTTIADIAYDATPDGTPQRRLLDTRRTLYMDANLSPLATGSADPLGLVYQSYAMRASQSLLTQVFTPKLTVAQLSTAVNSLTSGAADGGALVDLDGDGNLWRPSSRVLYSDPNQAPDPGVARATFYLPKAAMDPWGNIATVTYDAAHLLFVTATSDALGNTTQAQINYRVCGPWLMTDANLNRTGVRLDPLGRVVATAAMGKLLSGSGSSEVDEGDHLDATTPESSSADDPTTRLVYDLTTLPASVQTLSRVRHQDPSTPWIQSYLYTDGLGRAALTKAEAEPAPGDAPYGSNGTITRWVGTGKVVFDNKGNPVKAYEPFFDTTPAYTDETALVAQGVTSITRYDPLGRAYRVDRPDGAFRTVTFDPWQSVSSDENDTVTASSWYTARTTGPLSADAAQADAAVKAGSHAGTPTVTDLDVLGRVFRTTASNGLAAADQYVTTLTLDIQGRVLITNDALGRDALTQIYDMAGSELHHASVDAGERWLLSDCAGALLQAWDSRGFTFTARYDALRRPTASFVAEGTGAPRTAEETAYGETMPNPSSLTPSPAQSANLLGAAFQHDDGAGRATTVGRDFKGNVLSSSRELLVDLVDEVDWSSSPALTGEVFAASSSYDALNRLVTTTAPDGSVTQPVFNERSLLARVIANLQGAPSATTFVETVVYDAKGQRQSIAYGNGSTTVYSYDPETFRLTELTTLRTSDSAVLQDLAYAYDPVGNITRIGDAAQQTNFYNNQQVSPGGDYTYDPLYRLISAKGREHVTNGSPVPPDWIDSGIANLPNPNDTQALSNYIESYVYDPVGNLRSVGHQTGGSGWTRAYTYADPTTNRLSSTTIGATTDSYSYDAHGNVISMPHLSSMTWDCNDRLESTASQIVNDGTPATTYYRYDGGGQRVAKVTTSQRQAIVSERFYLGGYEIYRELNPAGTVTFQRDTLHVSDVASRLCLIETVTIDTTPTTAAGGPVATPSTAIRYQLGNHLDSALLELDPVAAVISYEEYYPYGATCFQAGRSGAEVGLKRYRFTGKERDNENGFYYHGARYYAPWLGRWTATDPAGLVDGASLYPYCRGNPIVASDPSGAQGQTGQQKPPAPPPPADDGGPYGHFEDVSNPGPRQPGVTYVVDRPPLPDWTAPTPPPSRDSPPAAPPPTKVLEPAPINPIQTFAPASTSEPWMANVAASFGYTGAPGGGFSLSYPFAVGLVHQGPFSLELVGAPTLTGGTDLTGTGGSVQLGGHATYNADGSNNNYTAYLQGVAPFGQNPPGDSSFNYGGSLALGYERHFLGDNDHPLLVLGAGVTGTLGRFTSLSPLGTDPASATTASLDAGYSLTGAANLAWNPLGYYDTENGAGTSKIQPLSLFVEVYGGGGGGGAATLPDGTTGPSGSNLFLGGNAGALLNVRLDEGRSILSVGATTGPRWEWDNIGGTTTPAFGWFVGATAGVSWGGRRVPLNDN